MDETKPRRAPRKTSSAGSAPKAKAKAPAKATASASTRDPVIRKAPAPTASGGAPPVASSAAAAATKPAIDPELRARMVETAAYFRAERRGFTPGYEVEDWLAAETEIESLVGGPASPARSGAGTRRKDG
jgi:7-keto-8-aminopelargonate synthetase-like enzyme